MPFKAILDSLIAIANESTVLLVLTTLLAFTGDQMDPEVGSNVGFILIGLIIANVSANAFLFIFTLLKEIFRAIKLLY